MIAFRHRANLDYIDCSAKYLENLNKKVARPHSRGRLSKVAITIEDIDFVIIEIDLGSALNQSI